MAGYAHKLVAGYVHKFLAGYVHKLMAGRVHKVLAGNFHRIVAGYVHKLVAGYGTLLRDSKKLLPRHSCGHSCKTRLPRLTDPPGFGVMPIDWLQVMFINWQATSVNFWQVMSIFRGRLCA